MGEISSKISSRPLCEGRSVRPCGHTLRDPLLPDVVSDEPVEALGLQCEQIGNCQCVGDFREREPRS